MSEERRHVCLGFTNELYPEGTHICYLYNNEEERRQVASLFVRCGLQERESVTYSADIASGDELQQVLEFLNVKVDGDTANGQFEIVSALDTFCPGGHFEPDAMLERLRQIYTRHHNAGFAGARFASEASWAVRGIPGSERLVEFEARINRLVEEVPLTVMCQFDARQFDGATIFDVISVHPIMMVRDNIIRNPFYIPPEQLSVGQHAASRHA
jgi:hypothetical protein